MLACGCSSETHDTLKGVDLARHHVAQERERQQRNVRAAHASLDAYVARRVSKGERVTIIESPHVSGPYARAKIAVDGTPRRLFRFACADATSRGWKYA